MARGSALHKGVRRKKRDCCKTKQNNSPAKETREAEAGRTLRGGSRSRQAGGRPETLESGTRPTGSPGVRGGQGPGSCSPKLRRALYAA